MEFAENLQLFNELLFRLSNRLITLPSPEISGEIDNAVKLVSPGRSFLLLCFFLIRSAQKFNDLAPEFYSFVADNFAPFYSMPVECTDRDAPFVLDGLLCNETDLPLYEHYTDTHGYTENNFAAFACWPGSSLPELEGFISNGYTR